MQEGRIFKKNILEISFVNLHEYLYLLETVTEMMQTTLKVVEKHPRIFLYLAAAVSDFYLPYSSMPEHKIQSRSLGNGLTIELKNSPKLLKEVRKLSKGFIMVSFKLETDEEILDSKVEKSFNEYSSDFIVGNLLQSKDFEVYLYKKVDDLMRKEIFKLGELDGEKTVEDLIVENLVVIGEDEENN